MAPGRAWRVSRTSGSEVEEERSLSEGGVYKVNKESIREEGDSLIVCVRGGNVIRSAR